MQAQGTRVYRVKAVAEMLDVHPATVYRAIADGRLDAYKIGTGRGALRVPAEALTTFMEECKSAVELAGQVGGVR
jgi:excisionase family DNA binding protein